MRPRTRRSLFVLLVLGFLSIHAAPAWRVVEDMHRWEHVAERLRASTGRIEFIDADKDLVVCSAFSINEEKAYFVTAFHCLGEQMTVDGQPAWAIFKNEANDLAVLEAPAAAKPALSPAAEDAVVGQSIGGLGYAEGFPIPQFRRGTVATPDVPPGGVTLSPPLTRHITIFDTAWAGGMSGGVVADQDAHVVSVIQMSDHRYSGLGLPLHVLLEQTGKFWRP